MSLPGSGAKAPSPPVQPSPCVALSGSVFYREDFAPLLAAPDFFFVRMIGAMSVCHVHCRATARREGLGAEMSLRSLGTTCKPRPRAAVPAGQRTMLSPSFPGSSGHRTHAMPQLVLRKADSG
mmetsp:Transcript_103105/g.298237  ORF Transcript_103105/g.298237 Transcript_103105/m.298237 type:complete len:123 (+) Transcript_103105:281-649(+)